MTSPDSHEDQVFQYYEQLAPTYDENRFENTYGHYIHLLEKKVLEDWLEGMADLDLGCGTGRLMPFARAGLDISPAMLAEARRKWPQKAFHQANAWEIPLADQSLEQVFCFHVVMHLEIEHLQKILTEVHRTLKSGGQFIFDIPALPRRKLLGYQARNWHGAFSMDIPSLKSLTKDQWQWEGYRGLLWMPIHRFPPAMRKTLRRADQAFGKGPLKKWASYYAIKLRKA
ncbi:MAG: class I SAM-dependent methyltransferase [Bacteroidota bacterium]